METLLQTTLEEAINNLDFNDIKNNYVTIKLKVKNSDWLESIDIEHCESTCMYDKTGFTYCLNLKCMPFRTWPMRNTNYIQTYKSVKRMLKSLYKSVKPETEVQI